MQPLSGNQRLDLLTSLMNMSLVLCLPREMHLSRSSSSAPRLPLLLETLQNLHVLLTFGKVENPLRLLCKTTSEPSKVVRTPGVLYILTRKCASRHNGVHFFDIATSKSGPNLVCFVHFDFEMCFAPQRRALFRPSAAPSYLYKLLYRGFRKCCVARFSHALKLSKPLKSWSHAAAFEGCSTEAAAILCKHRQNKPKRGRGPFWLLGFCKAPPTFFTFSPLWIATFGAPAQRPARLFRNCPTPARLWREHLPSPTATFASTRPYLPDFLTVSEQPFVTFGSAAPCLPDLERVLCCNLPPLVLQAAPAHTTSSLQTVPLPAKPCQTFFRGFGGTRESAHSYDIYIYMYVCMYVCLFVCLYVYLHMYIYIYIP